MVSDANQSDASSSMMPMQRVLLRPIEPTPENQQRQRWLDEYIDSLLPTVDLPRGLLGSAGVPLPHENIRDYWKLPADEKKRVISPEARQVYSRNAGRNLSAPLCVAAFCYASPLSRHQGNAKLLAFFEAGLRFQLEKLTVQSDGFDPEKLSWSHAWTIEGLLYGLTFLGSRVDVSLRKQADSLFSKLAQQRLVTAQTKDGIGGIGNQRLVHALGLELYGQWFNNQQLRDKASAYFDEALPLVLDDSGQVIEQLGPCMHYAHTAMAYAWLFMALRDDTTHWPRLVKCLRWFKARMTNDLTPMAGPSTRQYYDQLPEVAVDLLPVLGWIGDAAPDLKDWHKRLADKLASLYNPMPGATGHGASPLMWAMLLDQPSSSQPTAAIPQEPTPAIQTFDTFALHHRPMVRYLLAQQGYQTHLNIADFLPFAGIQTWAWGDEPPIIHPTPLHPSTTIGQGLDTARQGTSHNWGLFGAGVMAFDGRTRISQQDPRIAWTLTRISWLWRLVVFTPVTTLILEMGDQPRKTRWTLNRHAPTKVTINPGMVTFQNRQATLYCSHRAIPTLFEAVEDDAWARGVRYLEYDTQADPVIYALSDGSFRLVTPLDPMPGEITYEDGAGTYTLSLSSGFTHRPNAGLLRIDPFQLMEQTHVIKRM